MIEPSMRSPILPYLLLFVTITSMACSDDASPPVKDASAVGATVDAAVDAPSADGSDSGASDLSGCLNGCDVATSTPSADASGVDLVANVPDAGTDSGATQDVGNVDAPPGDAAGGSPEVNAAADVSMDAVMAVCKSSCEIIDMVTCPGVDPCLPDCVQAIQGKCLSARYAAQLCLAARQPSDYVCENDPVPGVTLRPGFCTPELMAARDCLLSP